MNSLPRGGCAANELVRQGLQSALEKLIEGYGFPERPQNTTKVIYDLANFMLYYMAEPARFRADACRLVRPVAIPGISSMCLPGCSVANTTKRSTEKARQTV